MNSRDIVVPGGLRSIDFDPASMPLEIVQNVRTILSTVKGTVPMDRLFGLSATMLDKPTPDAMAMMSSEIYGAIRKYEPRCRVKSINFEADEDGRLSPKVRIEVYE